MIKVIGLGGIPGTGKTTVMRSFLERADDWAPVKTQKLIDGLYSNYLETYVLGKYAPWYEVEGAFQGTDKLSMAVQPEVESWLENVTKNVVFEGDRLFSARLLETAIRVADDCQFYLLTASDSVLNTRYEERGSDQSDKFINGRKTKYRNIAENSIISPYIESVDNTNEEERAVIVEKMMEFLYRTVPVEREKPSTLENFF